MKIKKTSSNIGLDIGTSAVKLVELKFIKDTVELARFEMEPVQDDLISLLKRLDLPQSVNISVSGVSTVIRYIDFPRMDESQLKQALKFEGQKYIPFPVNEVNLDSYILRDDLAGNKIFVLIAAVKKDFLNQRLKLIQDAGLNAAVIDLDSLALVNAFKFNYSQDSDDFIKKKSIALLNVGASMSNLNILESGFPVLSRDIFIAGNNLNQRIQDSFGIDYKGAEELKLTADKEELNKVVTAFESVLADLAKEVRISFDFYESQSSSTVSKIFLSGGSSKFPGFNAMLSNLLGVEVEYWDPLKQVSIGDTVDSERMKPQAAQLAVAIGLALRR